MSAWYLFHLTYDETNNRYLINLVIAAAALVHGNIDDEEILDSLEAGDTDTDTENVLDTRTLNLINDLYEAYLEDQASNRPFYSSL